MDGCERHPYKTTGIKDDEAAACTPLLMHETEDESIFFRFAMRICNKQRFAYR
jgi:hypothetical protein